MRRAFAGATVHDVFNLLSVLVFVPLELRFHPLDEIEFVRGGILDSAGRRVMEREDRGDGGVGRRGF